MSIISDNKIKRLKEDIISILYDNHFDPLFTSKIANELIRDEEFILKLLFELKKEGFVKEINKNIHGKKYLSRKKWILQPKIYEQYKALSH